MLKVIQNVRTLPWAVQEAVLSRGTSVRPVHLTACCDKNQKAGKPKISPGRRVQWLTYEQAIPPEMIGFAKAWNSWNTSNLFGEDSRAPEVTVEDMLIRRFMNGLFPEGFISEIIIKRKHNIISIAGIISTKKYRGEKVYFLVGFAEELLSHWLKRPVKVELSAVNTIKDMHYKLI